MLLGQIAIGPDRLKPSLFHEQNAVRPDSYRA